MSEQTNPCENCIHQGKAWNDDPCYRCGSENNYAWCENQAGQFLNVKEHLLHFLQKFNSLRGIPTNTMSCG